jgi:hypothetical protein
MAVYTTINDPSAHFQTTIYTGNATSSTNINNTGNSNLQPDFVWIKNRTGGNDWHDLTDTTRGATKSLFSNNTNAQGTAAQSLQAFLSNGITIGSDAQVNRNNVPYASWQWKANGGTTVTNTDGATNGYNTTVQANQTAGFSIVKFNAPFDQGNGRYNLGHGLGVKPECIITKCSSASADWYIYHKDMGGSNIYLRLNLADATSTTGARYTFYEPAFTSTIFNMDWNNILLQNQDFICYCFAGVQGYSKFGKYIGNGSTDGTFTYTGFKPAFIIVKRINDSQDWVLWDHKRDGYNQTDKSLTPNEPSAEETRSIDILSNGFKQRQNNTATNADGSTYVYLAFASNPFTTSDGVPTTAR